MSDDHHSAINPAPPNVAELVDGDLIAVGLAQYLEEVDPHLFELLMGQHLSWTLEGFDALGVATVLVVANETGEPVSTARVHWTALCRPVVPDDLSGLDAPG